MIEAPTLLLSSVTLALQRRDRAEGRLDEDELYSDLLQLHNTVSLSACLPRRQSHASRTELAGACAQPSAALAGRGCPADECRACEPGTRRTGRLEHMEDQ